MLLRPSIIVGLCKQMMEDSPHFLKYDITMTHHVLVSRKLYRIACVSSCTLNYKEIWFVSQ